MNKIENLERQEFPLTCSTYTDIFTDTVIKNFDCNFNGVSFFLPWKKPITLPTNFKIGLIVGNSGSGKSNLLKQFGEEEIPIWDKNKAIISHFSDPNDSINKLMAVGLNTIPSWYKPYHVLSTGEKFRADLARKIKNNAVIDEFTSVIDRNIAKASSVALNRYIKTNDINNIVLATCHHDIIEWLEPDWVINTDDGKFYNGFFGNDQILNWKSMKPIEISGQPLKIIII